MTKVNSPTLSRLNKYVFGILFYDWYKRWILNCDTASFRNHCSWENIIQVQLEWVFVRRKVDVGKANVGGIFLFTQRGLEKPTNVQISLNRLY